MKLGGSSCRVRSLQQWCSHSSHLRHLYCWLMAEWLKSKNRLDFSVWLSTQLSWKEHIEYVKGTFQKRLNLMWAYVTLLVSLELIQNTELRYAAGPWNASLLQHCMCLVMLLAFHRPAMQTRFAIKDKTATGHMAIRMFTALWPNVCMKQRQDVFGNRLSMAVKTDPFFFSHPKEAQVVKGPEWDQMPPWLAKLPNIDVSLTRESRLGSTRPILGPQTRC